MTPRSSKLAAPKGETAISKGEFARLINVSPGRVSQMIAEGKIDGDALDGAGRSAKIRANVAKRQIAERTDISQRFGNGLSTRLELDLELDKPETANGVRQSTDPVGDQIKAERLRAQVMANERQAERRMIERGHLVLAADVSAALNRSCAQMLNTFEGAIGDFASAIAAKFNLPARDVLHLMRTEFHKVRSTAALAARHEAEGLPKTLTVHIPDASDPAAGEA